jgi:putative 2-hydroxy-3-oxopropionate reductase
MAERRNASGHDQDENRDNGIGRAAFGELRNRCDYVSEPWFTHADIYDEDGAVAVSDERSVSAQEACATGVYLLAGGFVVTDADLEADAARFEDGESTGEWAVLRERPSL